ncbi:MAG: PAS domain S-box protein [Cytophagales bacterium]|nr:MAG: PAS domain S-box protein [Cytophagales bacterium]
MKENFTIIGIGASAGGLEALMELLSHIPAPLEQVAFIIAQHLSPTHKSRLVELLGRSTAFKVVEAENGISLAPKMVYITPPDSDIRILKKKIKLSKPINALSPKPSVDILFESLAKDLKNKAIGIILSGTGSDGARGVKALKAAGSYILVQEPSTAKYDGMPISAINTNSVDLVLAPEKIGEVLHQMLQDPEHITLANKPIAIEPDSLQKIFKLLSKRTGTDFSNYKPATIGRRLEKRLLALKIRNIDTYLEYINENAQELDALFESILIGVTSFFRDVDVFSRLESYVTNIVSQKIKGTNIRIWVAGCATGEEPYSIAILLSKILRDNMLDYHIQIFATDIDEVAIGKARKGLYNANSLEGMPDDIINQYFLKKGDQYELIKQIRAMVLFSKHDLTHNPPFLKLDLISCRNLLIYFGVNLQKQVIPVFHYALNPNGYLLLGKSETIGQFAHLFSTVDAKNKIFQKKKGAKQFPVRFNTNLKVPKQETVIVNIGKKSAEEYTMEEMVKETIFTSFESPYVIVNDVMDIVEIRGDVRPYLSLKQGVANMNISKLVHPDLQIELRAILTKGIKDKKIGKGKVHKLDFFGTTLFVRMITQPVLFADDSNKLFLIIFESIDIDTMPLTFAGKQEIDIEKEENIKIIELEQELSITKEHLQSYIEELETSNEELQSLNEELQSTNEELQSSNEELETSNEELQSTNEEVQVAYEELKSANEELERTDALLHASEANINALLNNSMKSSILVDKQYKIVAFNNMAIEMFKKMSNKKIAVGESIISFIPPSLLPSFHQDILEAFDKKFTKNKEYAVAIDSKTYWFLMNYTPVVNENQTINAVSIGALEITDIKQLRTDLYESKSLLASIFDVSSVGICITDQNGHFVDINREYCQIYGYEKEELVGKPFTMVLPEENRAYVQNMHDNFIAGTPEMPSEWKVVKKDGTIIDIFVTASLLIKEDGSRLKVTCVNDITERQKYKHLLENTQSSAQIGGWDLDLITNKNTWTEEVYHIYEVPADYPINVPNGLKHYEPQDEAILVEALKNSIEKGVSYDLELRFISAQKTKKWVKVTCHPLLIGSKVIKLYGTIQDITKRKAYEVERSKLIDDLMQQNKDLRQFSYIVSHNLRSQVANMLGLFEIIEIDEISNKETVDMLSKIKSATTHLDNILYDLNEILNIRKNINENRQKIEWLELLETIKISLQKQIEEANAQIITDIKISSIFSIRGFIHSIFYNLISNALKYRSPKRDLKIYIKIYQENNLMIISISDNGLGIDLEKQKEKIFGLYKRFHFHTEGKGVGLYTVKTQVEILEGKIEVQSELEQGTTFTISLPANNNVLIGAN